MKTLYAVKIRLVYRDETFTDAGEVFYTRLLEVPSDVPRKIVHKLAVGMAEEESGLGFGEVNAELVGLIKIDGLSELTDFMQVATPSLYGGHYKKGE